MINASLTKSLSIGGQTATEARTIQADLALVFNQILAVAKTGTLSTRTDNDTGTLTMASGHGITTGARLDLFWVNGDGTLGHRRGITVGTVATNSVPIDGGAGDNLPTATTAITACVPTSLPALFDGDNVKAMMFGAGRKGVIVAADASNVELFAIHLDAGGSYDWHTSSGITNPLAGDDVAKFFISNGDSATVSTVVAGVAHDN